MTEVNYGGFVFSFREAKVEKSIPFNTGLG
jgi:hypothetical protein